MRLYINELSLAGQFESTEQFFEALNKIVEARARSEVIRNNIYCTRGLKDRPVCGVQSFASAVRGRSREYQQAILSWLASRGPFLEDDRQEEPDDYFEFEGYDVTELGLGEAARRVRVGQVAGVISFRGSNRNFERTPLTVQHGIAEEPFGHVDVLNEWDLERFHLHIAQSIFHESNWASLIERCVQSYNRLMIADEVCLRLAREPFSASAAGRIHALLSILNEYMGNRDASGKENARALDIRQNHFVGDKAWFTDESDGNKRDFREEMTFRDPEDYDRRITCFWHGKIKTPQYRIHFEWPVPPTASRLKILYIGPKISKR